MSLVGNKYECPLGYYGRTEDECMRASFSVERNRYGLGDYGFYSSSAHAVSHAIASPGLSKEQYKLAFSTRRRLDEGGKKALVLSPHLNKRQAKQLLKDYGFRIALAKNHEPFLRHGLVAEGLEMLGRRCLYSFALTPDLSEETYLKILDEQAEPGTEGRMFGESTRRYYPKHWYLLATREWTPVNTLREIYQREPQLAVETLQKRDDLPVDLLFSTSWGSVATPIVLAQLEARPKEVQAWLNSNFPELLDVPYEWVLEVLNGNTSLPD